MVRRGWVWAVAAVVVVGGCSDTIPAPDADNPPPAVVSSTPPDVELAPARQVLRYASDDATIVTVTDYSEIALQLGVELSSSMTAPERISFWRRAETETALLSEGVLRPVESELLSRFDIGQEDVAWEAHLFADDGTETGWVLGLRDSSLADAFDRAIAAGVGPLAGASVVDDRLVVQLDGAAEPGFSDSWAADPELVDLIGPPANGVYLERGCIPGAADTGGLDPLDAYSVSLEGQLATARLGLDRIDLTRRLALDDAVPDFAEGFTGGVVDESTGRIGFQIVDPLAAADLTLRHQLPFAACDA